MQRAENLGQPLHVVIERRRRIVGDAPRHRQAEQGLDTAVVLEPVVDAMLATAGLALLWRLAGRLGVASLADRAWLLLLFGFSTMTWWITVRGGVWHTGQLMASIITFAGLLERSAGAGRS